MTRALRALVRFIERLIEWLLVAALAALVVVVNAAVFARFVLDQSLTWNLEVSRILFIWIVFLGAALAVRRSAYSSIEIFSHRLPDWWSTRVVQASILGFGVVFASLGFVYIQRGETQVYVLTGLPVTVTHVAPLVFGVLVVVFAAANLLESRHRTAEESLAAKDISMG